LLECNYKWHYNVTMKFEWDETKRRENLAKHGLDFADALYFTKGKKT